MNERMKKKKADMKLLDLCLVVGCSLLVLTVKN
jgi:hypothetical protein